MESLHTLVPKILANAKKPANRKPARYEAKQEIGIFVSGRFVTIEDGQVVQIIKTKEVGYLIHFETWIHDWQEISPDQVKKLITASRKIKWN